MTARARSGTGVGPRPAALVPPSALGRAAAAAHVLHGLGVPARFRLDVRPADVRETGQPGPAQREPTNRLVAPALPRMDLARGIADPVVGVDPLVRGLDRRVAYSHERADTPHSRPHGRTAEAPPPARRRSCGTELVGNPSRWTCGVRLHGPAAFDAMVLRRSTPWSCGVRRRPDPAGETRPSRSWV